MKSVLSLSDQALGSQPLERIMSSLSIASNKNSSRHTLTIARKSLDKMTLLKSRHCLNHHKLVDLILKYLLQELPTPVLLYHLGQDVALEKFQQQRQHRALPLI